ncbi:uncharacterized protein Fot_48772 [Forsythia ovata]|uniref:Uncharacterized protein n=1 Tax=Forsythia ovata TaxID=205694 RepID=A0ABD1QE82_9LAMI
MGKSRNETDLEAINICEDCKFLFLEDLETTTPDSYRRRTLGLRRRRYNSSKSMESLFSYQFSQMITLARQTQSTVLEHDNQSIDSDGAARLVQLTSTRTTPSGSRRWRRVFSDTESDGFDSFYRKNESNVSFRRYRHFPGEDDTISYTIYGGDYDASIGGNLENENLQFHSHFCRNEANDLTASIDISVLQERLTNMINLGRLLAEAISRAQPPTPSITQLGGVVTTLTRTNPK